LDKEKTMKKTLCLFFATLIFSVIFATPSFSETINAGTGGQTGNYFGMMNDINSYCKSEIGKNTLEVISTGGSLDNLTGIMNKKYTIAIVQEDVLNFMEKQIPRKVNGNVIKVISGLHLETAHLLIPFDYKPETGGGFFSGITGFFSGNDDKPLSLEILKGQKVASSGGSIVSLKALSYFLDLKLQIVEMNMPELLKSKNMPIFLVGGQPYKPVEDILSANLYSLISIDFDKLKAQAPFYLSMQANYKIKGKRRTINTFAVRALLVGKSFRKSSRNVVMSKLATCISEKLTDLADDSDTNPNWGTVYELEEKEGSQSGWPYFPLIEK
jgi:hypothetical protein